MSEGEGEFNIIQECIELSVSINGHGVFHFQTLMYWKKKTVYVSIQESY